MVNGGGFRSHSLSVRRFESCPPHSLSARFRGIIDVREEAPSVMGDDEEKNSDETINKIVWGVIYLIAFLAAIPTVLDILGSLF